MPIRLRVPAHRPGGPDGQGWNRFSLGSLADDECTLRPTDYSHYMESQDTRRAGYGGYGSCIRDGACDSCPVFARTETMAALTDRVLVRIHPADGRPWLMNRPEDGWGSRGQRWTWERLAALSGWYPDGRHHDQDGDGFWLQRADDNPQTIHLPFLAT
ncbi:hypothetical protein [Streptacidiphilus sp. PAMC 29251]